jgi:hypothetical protein
MLPADIAAGPIDAFVIRMGTPPYEPRRGLAESVSAKQEDHSLGQRRVQRVRREVDG